MTDVWLAAVDEVRLMDLHTHTHSKIHTKSEVRKDWLEQEFGEEVNCGANGLTCT